MCWPTYLADIPLWTFIPAWIALTTMLYVVYAVFSGKILKHHDVMISKFIKS